MPPPLEKNYATISIAIYIAHRFLRKNMDGSSNFCTKKNKKNISGGPPNKRTWPNSKKVLKIETKNINLPVAGISPYEMIISI